MAEQKAVSKNEQSQFIVKSKANFWFAALRSSIFIIIPVGFVIFFLSTAKESDLSLFPIIIFVSAVWIILWLMFTGIKYVANMNAEYHFFIDRIEYYNKFFDGNNITLYYNNMERVRLSEGFLQKRFNWGSIYIDITNYVRSADGKLTSYIIIDTIENPERLYDWLNNKIKHFA